MSESVPRISVTVPPEGPLAAWVAAAVAAEGDEDEFWLTVIEVVAVGVVLPPPPAVVAVELLLPPHAARAAEITGTLNPSAVARFTKSRRLMCPAIKCCWRSLSREFSLIRVITFLIGLRERIVRVANPHINAYLQTALNAHHRQTYLLHLNDDSIIQIDDTVVCVDRLSLTPEPNRSANGVINPRSSYKPGRLRSAGKFDTAVCRITTRTRQPSTSVSALEMRDTADLTPYPASLGTCRQIETTHDPTRLADFNQPVRSPRRTFGPTTTYANTSC